MALDLESLSITSVFNSIVSYFRSQENNSKWRELSSNSEGSFLIRMLSNIVSNISYRIVAQSRENYLSTAALPASNIGIAVNLGYSVFRGSNLKRKINLIPSGSHTLPKFSVIGTYSNDYTILTLEDVDLKEGEEIEINTVVGNLREESFVTGTSDIKIFSLFTTGISEDYILLRDNEEVPTTNIMKGMIEDKYLVRTNPYSSVDIAYLNDFENAKFKYGTGTELTVRYVELADVPVVPYSSNMFNYGTLTNYSTISTYLPFEDVSSIKIRGPLDHETQNLIRSKADYANRLMEIVPSITEVNFKALTPTYTQITYLKNDFTLLIGTKQDEGDSQTNKIALTNTEVGKVNDILREENFFGTPLPDITVPRREVANIKIQLALSNKYKSVSDIDIDIKNILKSYYNSYLNVTFNTYELERILENLSYVKFARVSYVINERKVNTNYQLGYMCGLTNSETGEVSYYKVSKILGYSGSAEPSDSWPVPINPGADIDTQAVIKDGTVYWKCFKKLLNMPPLAISKRQSNAQYGIGDFVYVDEFPDYMFKCVDLVRMSGGVIPDITGLEIGEFIADGGIVWVVKDRISDANSWQPYTQYRLNDTINVSSENYSLECVSYTGTTGTVEDLSFENQKYPVTEQGSNYFTVSGNKVYYFKGGDTIKAQYAGGYTTFIVVSSVYISSGDYTIVTVKRSLNEEEAEESVIDSSKTYTYLFAVERGTKDGGILWSLVDNINRVSYDWNSFVTFFSELEIIEE